MKKLFSSLSIVVLVVAAAAVVPMRALADRPEPKIRICHATDSQTNPYTNPDVDQDSVDGDLGNDHGQGDHYAEHNGPVWYEGIADHSWGDIIPPIEGVHQGKNWTEDGQKIWNNACSTVFTTPTPTVTPDPTITPDPTATPSATPTEDPTPTATPTPEQHNDNGGGSSSGSSSSSSSSSSTPAKEEGQVLGATTYGGTGVADDIALNVAGIIGAVSFTAGLIRAKRFSK